MSAPWCPPWTATSSAASATTVLPEPTSPWSSRCMGSDPARSALMASMARRWAAGQGEGQPRPTKARLEPTVRGPDRR